jgi:hypothetical protein
MTKPELFRGKYYGVFEGENGYYTAPIAADGTHVPARLFGGFGWDEETLRTLNSLASKREAERERIEVGHELVRLGRKPTNLIQRDIVDMGYDAGLTPKEALDIERQAKPFERLISDGEDLVRRRKLAMQGGEIEFSGAYPPPAGAAEAYADAERWRNATGRESALHRIQREAYERRGNDVDYRAELAREFREAVDALQQGLLHETTCDWCGADVQTINDHRMVDGQPMCLPCVKEYGLEECKDYER